MNYRYSCFILFRILHYNIVWLVDAHLVTMFCIFDHSYDMAKVSRGDLRTSLTGTFQNCDFNYMFNVTFISVGLTASTIFLLMSLGNYGIGKMTFIHSCLNIRCTCFLYFCNLLYFAASSVTFDNSRIICAGSCRMIMIHAFSCDRCRWFWFPGVNAVGVWTEASNIALKYLCYINNILSTLI